MNSIRRILLLAASLAGFLVPLIAIYPQGRDSNIAPTPDPCGYPDTTTALYRLQAMANWGYGYDSLLADLSRWSQSPFVRVDTIGTSVQQRGLFMLTIEDTLQPTVPRKRVWIHARTHPAEVQGTWVTNQMIALLLSDLPFARTLRDSCVFNILPMLNPDGVELGRSRENANLVDLESNWSKVPGEPEVQALRAAFNRLMATSNPILTALNMHSSVSCTRYFVFHAAGGTSMDYASLEEKFINLARSHFPGGIEPWDYFVSWQTSAPTYYPESWFWYNHHEAVLALTYEDMNCPSAGEFDKTATALLRGTGEYIGVLAGSNAVVTRSTLPDTHVLSQNYPNPFNPVTTIRYEIAGTRDHQPASGLAGGSGARQVRLGVYDLLGREVATLVDERKEPGTYTVQFSAESGDAPGLAGGVYFYRLTAGQYVESRRMVLVK